MAEISCEVKTTVRCENIPTVHTVHDDTALELTFQTHTAHRANFTKEQCDAKWIINNERGITLVGHTIIQHTFFKYALSAIEEQTLCNLRLGSYPLK